jgi:hypothetical protein
MLWWGVPNLDNDDGPIRRKKGHDGTRHSLCITVGQACHYCHKTHALFYTKKGKAWKIARCSADLVTNIDRGISHNEASLVWYEMKGPERPAAPPTTMFLVLMWETWDIHIQVKALDVYW